ncbi:ABC transporter ATP-binding protein [Phosphitispora fastidiosa]|uniref:ABC transporter ATP-binding protein n=1 Tax=Phosphitispora fastidiosa TaxID=2837202 RepID=UPI001E60B906|nr:ABC transporter ATP-binding protein [Phosphitispora fastidiosa]MBU7005326.1 NitT/TauT family transport system ATP-binding protein [Phosphitispora fastidiosa]
MGNDSLIGREEPGKLRISDVSKTFTGGIQNLAALEKVSMEIDEGDFVCILGPSGCGKTTLLRCVAGLEKPDSGEIVLGETPVRGPGPDRIVVFQDFDQLLPWKTVKENVAFPLKVNKKASEKEIRDTVKQNLALVGLNEFENYYPHQLSGGMKQRAAIARALTVHPKVLLMDEPFASVDSLTRMSLQNELIKIWEKFHPTIVFITHNVEEAVILGSRIAVMSSRPGTIKKVITNELPRPRTVGSAGFSEKWNELNNLLVNN